MKTFSELLTEYMERPTALRNQGAMGGFSGLKSLDRAIKTNSSVAMELRAVDNESDAMMKTLVCARKGVQGEATDAVVQQVIHVDQVLAGRLETLQALPQVDVMRRYVQKLLDGVQVEMMSEGTRIPFLHERWMLYNALCLKQRAVALGMLNELSSEVKRCKEHHKNGLSRADETLYQGASGASANPCVDAWAAMDEVRVTAHSTHFLLVFAYALPCCFLLATAAE